MDSKNEIGIAAGIVAIFLLVLFTGFGVYSSLTNVIYKVDESAKPNMRLLLLEQVLANLATAESSVKSYNLTRDKSYLTPFYKSLVGVDAQLQSLKNKNQTDTSYQQLTDSVEQLVAVKYDILSEIIGLGNTEKVAEELQQIAKQAEQSSRQALALLKQTEVKKVEPKPKFWQRLFKKKKAENTASTPKTTKPAPTQVLNKVQQDISRSVALVKREQIRQLKSLKAQELALLQLDKQVMYNIRSLVSHMQYLERKRIIYDAAEVSQLVQKNNNRIVVFSLTIVLLLVVVGYTLVLYIKKNYETNLALNKAKNEAESLAKAKETFLAGMSHEIRTPLNAIIGFTEQLYNEQLSVSQQTKVDTIKNAGSHLLGVINEVLDFTKITAGKLVLNPVSFNPVAEIEQVLSALQTIAQQKGITLTTKLPATISWCMGDKVRFNQVLYNLIGNAIKFTEKGEVKVALKSTLVNEKEVELTLAITDTGIGIGKEEMGRLFNEFEQANQTVQHRFGGTGLGLSICKRIIELQGGSLTLQSELGKGTTVHIGISYPKTTINTNQPIVNLPAKGEVLKGVKVLVADDNLYNRELLKTILNKWGASISEAEDGEQAFELITNKPIELCLIDVKMPKLNGIELTDKIRKLTDKAKNTVPILALTATVTNQERAQLFGNGANGVITKPFKELELYELIATVSPNLIKQKVVETITAQRVEQPKTSTHKLYDTTELYKMGDDKFVTEMLTVFTKTLSSGVQKLRTQFEENKWAAVADTAHQLIPSCRHLEVNELMHTLKQLEHEAGLGTNTALIEQLLQTIEELAQQVLSQLETELAAK